MSDIGIANVINGVLYPAASLPTEIIGIVSVLLVLLVSQPLTALITLVYLGGIAFLLFIWISKKAQVAGRVNRDYALKMVSLIAEMVSALKEITLRDKSSEVGAQIQSVRLHVARSRSNIRFLQAVPKFVVDMALIGGFLVIGGVAWLVDGQQGALGAVAIFSIAGFKIIPAITRAQNFATTIHANVAFTTAVVADINDAARYEREAQELGRTPMPASPGCCGSPASSSPTRARSGRRSTPSTSPCPSARPSRSSAPPGPASPPSSTCCWGCSSRPAARSTSTAIRCPTCSPTGAPGSATSRRT